ncbi:MAG: hypothetical protein LBC02_13280 [Planctomycetaceae bacterium]|nr:hypothetical protein [Planctomycetaceae bacterium]
MKNLTRNVVNTFYMIIIFFGLFVFFSVQVSAQELTPDFSTYEGRKAAVLASLKDVELKERGKHGIPRALARLHNDPKDKVAQDYLANVLDPKLQTMFDLPGIALAMYQYKDQIPYEDWKKIWGYLERLDTKNHSVGEGFMGHGTENHALMMWVSAYLFAQQRPDQGWSNGMSSAEIKVLMKERLRKMLKNVYRMGYAEYLSTTYDAVLNLSMEILYMYAADPEVKAMAEAYLLYKWSILSLNAFDGEIIAPHARMNVQIDHRSPDQKESELPAASYYNWVLWGWGAATNNVKLTDFRPRSENGYNETSYAIYAALSKAKPDAVFFRLAANKEPFTQWSSTCMFGGYGAGAPRWMLRKVYRDKTYAVGTGNFRWVPGGDYADHDAVGFGIYWSSADRFNYINCYSPFWYSDADDPSRTPDTWDHGQVSPFQQTAQHENTVITLFNIPDKDPWYGFSDQNKWVWRDGHAENLIKRGMLRFPKSVDEQVEENGWIFLREGATYIGIKPLKDYYVQSDLSGHLKEFTVVKSDHAQTGFVFELGTEEEFGNFAEFRAKLPKNKLEINWEKLTVAYTNSRNSVLEIQYVSGLPIVPVIPVPSHWQHKKITGFAESVPVVTINGIVERFLDGWPMIESPVIRMNNSVLQINDGKNLISVDWQNEYPVIIRR